MTLKSQSPRDWRDRLTHNLGITPVRKAELYTDLIQSVTLTDVSYWLQVLFAAGIATLGLLLNSPAVIIGAMLISPLMGPILANGMAFAAGDVVLALRAIASLAASCVVAVLFAMLLIAVMPFKEQTAEILARTQPNALDLVIALFSGALGSVATCKEPKGVVTSIPGVAIAVALMPPLCVTGYGLGFALSINPVEGWPIARGGALLFVTNLAAITFMAMVVFSILHIATPEVKKEIKEIHLRDDQSRWMLSFLRRIPASGRLRIVGSLPSRFLAIALPLVILLVPLYQSLGRLQKDILARQENNQVRRVATDIWQNSFANTANGEPRAYLSQLSTQIEPKQLILQMTVFTSRDYSPEEKAVFTQQVAERLRRPSESVLLQLIEIPTTSNELIQRTIQAPPEPVVETLPSVTESQQQLLNAVETALSGLSLPEPAQLLRYDVITSPAQPLTVALVYLSPRAIDPDARLLLTEELLRRLQFPEAQVRFERIPAIAGRLTFDLDGVELSEESKTALDRLGTLLQDHPQLQTICEINVERQEPEAIAIQRYRAIRQYLVDRWQISPNRLAYQKAKTLPDSTPPITELRMNYPKPMR